MTVPSLQDEKLTVSRGPRDLTEEDFTHFREWTLAKDIDSMQVLLKYLSPSQQMQLANLPLLPEPQGDAAADEGEEANGAVLLHYVAVKGEIELARVLISAGAHVAQTDARGNTAVHLAVRGGHYLFVKTLYDHGALLNTSNTLGETALGIAAGTGALQCVKELFLCANGAGSVQVIDCELQTIGNKMTPFLLACAGAHLECAKELLQHSPHAAHAFSDRADNGAHLILIHLAHLQNQSANTEEGGGQERGRNTQVRESETQSFHIKEKLLSVEFASTFFEMLSEAGGDVFSKNIDGVSPAALSRSFQLSSCSEVLENLNNVVVQGDLEKTLSLCTCKHCIHRADLRRESIIAADDSAAMSSLISNYAAARASLAKPVDDDDNSLVHLLCRTGKTSCLKALLSCRWFDNTLICKHNQTGESPLHVSIRASKPASLKILLAHIAGSKHLPSGHASKPQWLGFAVLDTVDDLGGGVGQNCLHLSASVSEGAPMLDRLLQALEDSNFTSQVVRVDRNGWTPFHIAAYWLQIDCLRVIIKRVGTRSPLIHALTSDELKQTSVHLAVQARPSAPRSEADLLILPMIRELVLLGTDATALDTNCDTAETLARKLFLVQVADVLRLVESPSSKLTRAVIAQDEETIRLQLEDMKATGSLGTIDGKGRDGLSPLHHACKIGVLSCIDLLLQFEADICDSDIEKNAQPLWWATRYKHANVAAFLCRKKAPPSARAKDGSSALHNACYNGMTATTETLLADRTLDTAWRDGHGLTALDLAVSQGNASTVKAYLIARPASVSHLNAAGESALFSTIRCVTSKAVDIAKLLVEEECDPSLVNNQGQSLLEVARQHNPPNPALIDFFSSLLNTGVGYIAEEEDAPPSDLGVIRPRRPRVGGKVSLDSRLTAPRLASARLAAQAQDEAVKAKRQALEVQRQEALARREADKTRCSLRAALMLKSSAQHAVGHRSGRLTAEVIMAKIDNQKNADGHVLKVERKNRGKKKERKKEIRFS